MAPSQNLHWRAKVLFQYSANMELQPAASAFATLGHPGRFDASGLHSKHISEFRPPEVPVMGFVLTAATGRQAKITRPGGDGR